MDNNTHPSQINRLVNMLTQIHLNIVIHKLFTHLGIFTK